jgi:hypothetical protein
MLGKAARMKAAGGAFVTDGLNNCVYNILGLCLEIADKSPHYSIFGIAEFLTIVAIFAVAYNVSDDRYKFRINISPIPLLSVFFYVTVCSAIILIANTLWFDFALPIPRVLNNPLIVQTLVAIVLIALLAVWLHVAFLKPPRFSRRNSVRFAQQVFQGIAGGNEQELAAAAYEVGRSAHELVATARQRFKQWDWKNGGFVSVKTEAAQIADEVLLLLGDRRFCRHVAKHAPWVAAGLFKEVGSEPLGDLEFVQFARNVSAELLADTDTAIHHEDEWFRSGLIGHLKPVSISIFGNSELVEALASRAGSPLNLLWQDQRAWGARSWDTYNRAVLLYISDWLKKRRGIQASTALHQIFHSYEHLRLDAYRINEMPDGYHQSIEFRRIRKAVDFLTEAIKLLEELEVSGPMKAYLRDGRVAHPDIFDLLSEVALELIVAAGSVDTPDFRSWEVQHNTVWSPLLRDYSDSKVRAIFRARLQRLIWKEIRDMESAPNYRGARVILVCLNVMGFKMDHAVRRPKEIRALKRALLKWVRQNYLKLRKDYPDVARACTGASLSFDPKKKTFIKTYGSLLGKKPNQDTFQL